MGNIFLTSISNFINKQKLTDAHTCYKVIKSEIFKKIKLVEKRFAFCPEITTKLAKANYDITEVSLIIVVEHIPMGKNKFYRWFSSFVLFV